MTNDEFAHWLLSGNPAEQQKIDRCMTIATTRDGTLERVGKSVCHLLYRAIEGCQMNTQRLIIAAERAMDMAEFATSESRLQKSRWTGSIGIALAYFLILRSQNVDDAIVVLDGLLDMRAVDDHPQNVLNIQRAALLLAAIHVSRGDRDGANRAIAFSITAFRRAASSVCLDRHLGVMGEMHRWVNALGVGVALNAEDTQAAMRAALLQERQEPFRSAMREILSKGDLGEIDRRGLASLFNGNAVELGVASGSFSKMILENGSCSRLWSIDRWSDHHDISEYIKASNMLAGINPGVSLTMRMTFEEALPHFGDESLDAIYIDGYAHAGQEDGATLAGWWPKLKRGGLFAGHDYHPQWPKTIEAVDRFAAENGFEFKLTVESNGFPSWYGRKS
jgi:hypothetical protein